MTTSANGPSEVLRSGILACREGRWREGYELLSRLAQVSGGEGKLPGVFYAYFGQAVARCEGRKSEGLKLCRLAVTKEPFRPENHLNLAEVQLIVGNRRAAIRAMKEGLSLDPEHRGLLLLRRRLGIRRRPPIPFLSRSNPINVWLGKQRYEAELVAKERRKIREEEAALDRV